MMIEDESEVAFRGYAKRSAETALAKGFTPVTWDIIPARLMMVITELDEITRVDANVGQELADVTIRTIGMLHVLFPGWTLRVQHGPWRPRSMTTIETELWGIVRFSTHAVEAWRKGDSMRVKLNLELIVSECFRLSHVFRVKLGDEVVKKMNANDLRPHLHGAKEAL